MQLKPTNFLKMVESQDKQKLSDEDKHKLVNFYKDKKALWSSEVNFRNREENAEVKKDLIKLFDGKFTEANLDKAFHIHINFRFIFNKADSHSHIAFKYSYSYSHVLFHRLCFMSWKQCYTETIFHASATKCFCCDRIIICFRVPIACSNDMLKQF